MDLILLRLAGLRSVQEAVVEDQNMIEFRATTTAYLEQIALHDQHPIRPDNILSIGFGPGEGGHHPAQKPVRLMEFLIDLVTKPGHTVLDSYAGSGSTLIAAHGLNRTYLGCESSPTYAEVCRSRLASIGFQLSLAPKEAPIASH